VPAGKLKGLAVTVRVGLPLVVSVPDGETLNQVVLLKMPCEETVYVVLLAALTVRVVDAAAPLTCGVSVSAEELRVNVPDPETLLPETASTIGIVSGKFPPVTEMDPL
jgi:hypothetical protein